MKTLIDETTMKTLINSTKYEHECIYKVIEYAVKNKIGVQEKITEIMNLYNEYKILFEDFQFIDNYTNEKYIKEALKHIDEDTLAEADQTVFYSLPEYEKNLMIKGDQDKQYDYISAYESVREQNDDLKKIFDEINDIDIHLHKEAYENFDMTPIQNYDNTLERFSRYGGDENHPRVKALYPQKLEAEQRRENLKVLHNRVIEKFPLKKLLRCMSANKFLVYLGERLQKKINSDSTQTIETFVFDKEFSKIK
jgi:hypothetical protein